METLFYVNWAIGLVLPVVDFPPNQLHRSVPIGTLRGRHLYAGAKSRCYFYLTLSLLHTHILYYARGREKLEILVAWCLHLMGSGAARDSDWALWLGDGKWLVCHFCSLSLWQWWNVSRQLYLLPIGQRSLAGLYLHLSRSLALCTSAQSQRWDGVKRAPAHRPLRHRINQIARPPAPSLAHSLKSRFLILNGYILTRPSSDPHTKAINEHLPYCNTKECSLQLTQQLQ